ncbi:MAG: hypothetical protein WCQ41_06230 [Bacillota bacterium]
MDNGIEIVRSTELNTAISKYEENILQALSFYGLPIENIFVSLNERKKTFSNADDVINILSAEQRSVATYISKFFAAVGAGLFDAALNYLWDETIVQLRKRVSQYDIQYFYDLAVSPDKRAKLSTAEDLIKLDDSELIKGAKEIDLISDIGYRHLDYIKYMRNWASAAHPNQTSLTGLQIISWLETCIREVICLPETNVTVTINRLLSNIKSNVISKTDADTIGSFFYSLSDEKANSLASGFFGIFTRRDSTEATRQNIHLLLPLIWERVNEGTRYDFGAKYAQYSACNDQDEARLARTFLQIVNAEQYIPDVIRSVEIRTAIENLTNAHHRMNNFYSEPSFAQQLKRLVGVNPIPKELDLYFARSLVYVFISNGNGVCWDADSIYISLIANFNQRQTASAVMSFLDNSISSKLQFPICKEKFLELIRTLKQKAISPPLLDMINNIENYRFSLSELKNDASIKPKIEALKILLK